ncbi:MAG: 1-acyl-sn-glycerol-3-phosphate acyltransferase [Kangiellaceae bacterium]|nr:1-acyl-sn-glycerol-3-phosphate acyltransferase [Kangiellaceae bacterium]
METWFVALSILVALSSLIVVVGNRYNGTDWGHPATNILDGWLRLYCKKFHRQGNTKISVPEGQALILVSNHLSAIDPFLLIAAIDRPVRFMIAKEEYDKPILNWMFKGAGCIPVDRGGRVEGAFRSALRAIKRGELVAIFPQGGIHSDDTPRERIKPGVIKLSELSGCSLLPVRINGIAAPGTMFKSIVKRSHIKFDVSEVVDQQTVLSESFRSNLSDWFVHKRQDLMS